MSNGLPPQGEQADAWKQRLDQDPTAIVALADHLLRTCGIAMRMGAPVDPSPLFEMLGGLKQVPQGGPTDAPLARAIQLLEGGGLALAGYEPGAKLEPGQLPGMIQEIAQALTRGDEPRARSAAAPVLGAMLRHQQLPELPAVPEGTPLAEWIDAVHRVRQARWGTH